MALSPKKSSRKAYPMDNKPIQCTFTSMTQNLPSNP